MRTCCSFPVARSFAFTSRMPFASMSNVTSICGTPRGADGIPSRMNFPSVLLSVANSRSPCSTWISTCGWLSDAVEKVWLFDVGMVVFRSMSFVITPPSVSMPSESGVTSSNSTSFTSPARTPPWIAAPIATTSSGFTPFDGSLPPKSAFTASTTAGMRVIPPTRTTSSISDGFRPASFSAAITGAFVFSIRSATSDSSFALVNVTTTCFGPVASAVMYGRLISVWPVPESSIFAFSAASFRR